MTSDVHFIPESQEPEDEYHIDPNYNPANDEVAPDEMGDAHFGELPPDPEATV